MTSRLTIGAIVGSVALAGCAGVQADAGGEFAGCKAYGDTGAAQRAWRRAGRPPGADGDRDGRVCETSRRTAARTRACRRVARVVAVRLSARRYPETTDHIADAIATGQPSVLHLDRDAADANRDESLAGIPTRKGYDRDEWPIAASRESSSDADVRYVRSADNRGAGAVLGEQLEPYCDGQAFRVMITGGRRR